MRPNDFLDFTLAQLPVGMAVDGSSYAVPDVLVTTRGQCDTYTGERNMAIQEGTYSFMTSLSKRITIGTKLKLQTMLWNFEDMLLDNPNLQERKKQRLQERITTCKLETERLEQKLNGNRNH